MKASKLATGSLDDDVHSDALSGQHFGLKRRTTALLSVTSESLATPLGRLSVCTLIAFEI
jgi:hypothetical protein